MKKTVVIIVSVILCVLVGFYLSNTNNTNLKSCEILDSQMVTGYLHNTYFGHFKDKNKRYPKDLNELRKFLEIEKTNYTKLLLEEFEKQIIDPFSNEDYQYFAIRVKGVIVDYILYSVGPDGDNDNLDILLKYERNSISSVNFKALPFDCDIGLHGDGDVVVRLPGMVFNKEFKFIFDSL